MRYQRFIILLASALVLLLLATPALAAPDSFVLGRHTIDGGGPVGSGDGRFILSATVGQPDASFVQGQGRFTLSGGFWRQDSGETETSVFLPLVAR